MLWALGQMGHKIEIVVLKKYGQREPLTTIKGDLKHQYWEASSSLELSPLASSPSAPTSTTKG